MIFTLFKKELKDTLRDRRTIIAMIVVPILVFPLILGLSTTISKSFAENQQEEELMIAVVTKDGTNQFIDALAAIPDSLGPKTLIHHADTVGVKKSIQEDSIQLAFVIPPHFDQQQQDNKQSVIHIYLKGSNIGNKSRAQQYLTVIKESLTQKRMKKLNLDQKIMQPIAESYVDLSSDQEIFGKLAGGFLPYLFIIFGFIGCLYPAIDLFTGEKERKTLETLLTTPVSRWKILVGKMLVIVLSGIAAATFALVGLFISLNLFNMVNIPGLMDVVDSILNFSFILTLYLLLIPLTIFFAGIMVPITISAKSFKEAQSILTPINFVVILPTLVGFIPGVELDYSTVFIPIVNIVLATKELVSGTLDPILMICAFLAMIVYAGISVAFSYKRFGKESNIVS